MRGVLTDIDDTLTDHGSLLAPARQALHALAAAGVPVFVISTHDTDWLLVSADRFAAARTALEGIGHRFTGAVPLA